MATKKTSNKSASKEPTTMEELLAMEGVEIRGLQRGDIVEGTVTSIGGKVVLIDIGAKTEGMVVDKEFAAAREYVKTLTEGDVIEAYVISPENESGQILLSLRAAAEEFNWGKISEWKETNDIVRVKVLEVNRGGAIVTVIDDINGFIPGSQFSEDWQERMEELQDRDIEVRILDFDRAEGKLILSEKNVSEAEDLEKREKVVEMLSEDAVYNGVVTRVVPFGLFVKLDLDEKKLKKAEVEDVEMEGLVHISEISWEKVKDPVDIAGVGDEVKVKVIKAEAQVGKLSLSMKRLENDPWDGIAERYPVDSQTVGKIVRVAPFGVFVELDKGIEGLIHVSKLSSEREFNQGDEIEVYIESVDLNGRRISLGMVLKEVSVMYK